MGKFTLPRFKYVHVHRCVGVLSLSASERSKERLEELLAVERKETARLTKEVDSVTLAGENLGRELQERDGRIKALEAELKGAEGELERAKSSFEERAEEVSREARVAALSRELAAAEEQLRRLERVSLPCLLH